MPTKIEWCDETWNPVTGCTKAGEGCRHCYAHALATRFPRIHCTCETYPDPIGPGQPENHGFDVIHFHTERLAKPMRWRKPKKVFVCSMGDLFHPDVTEAMVGAVLLVASVCARHTFMILTKRPHRMREFFERNDFGSMQGEALAEYGEDIAAELIEEGPAINASRGGWPMPNVYLGVTAENQSAAEERLPFLLDTPATVRFLSCEPMLGPISLLRAHQAAWEGTSLRRVVDWVICGGETGPGARILSSDQARALRNECEAAKIPFFFKRLGDRRGTPKDLRVRQWPRGKR